MLTRARYLPCIALWFSLLTLLLSPGTAWMQGGNVFLTFNKVDDARFPEIQAFVTVADADGFPIPDLTTDDFEVLEDGKPVEIKEVTTIAKGELGIALMLVIDTSGSMSAGGGVPIRNAKAAALSIVEGMGANDMVAIVAFSGEIEPFPVLHSAKETEFTNDKGFLNELINSLQANGNTPLYDATVKAVKMTARQPLGNRAIVLLTDGRDEGSKPGGSGSVLTEDDAIAEASEAKIPIYTIGLGRDIAEKYLQRLAQRTGGKYERTDDPEELKPLFEEVRDRLRLRYVIRYESDLVPDHGDHSILIKVKKGEGEDEAIKTFVSRPPETPGIRLALEEGQELSGQIAIKPEVFARDEIERVEFWVGGELLHTDNSAPYIFYWNTAEPRWWESGGTTHDLTVRVYDVKGRVGERVVGQLEVLVPTPTPTYTPTSVPTATPTPIPVPIAPLVTPPPMPSVSGGLQPWSIALIAGVALSLLAGLFFLIWRSRKPVCPNCGRRLDPHWTECPFCAAEVPTYVAEAVTAEAGPAREAEVLVPPLQPTRPVQPPKLRLAWLVVEKGMPEGGEFRLHEGETTIGRAGTNDIILDDPAISRRQAMVKLEGEEFYLYDLAATNPTRVNGQVITRQRLLDGDRVEMGHSRLVFKRAKEQ